jgi:two-component system cell cycle sensor histidine kinase/response regulator CckA
MKDENKSRDELIAEIKSLRMENIRLNKIPSKIQPVENKASGETILIVDDNKEARDIMVAMVKRLGYKTIEAESPRGAIDLFAKQNLTIDLILTDIVMPDGGGPAMVNKILKSNPDIKVIFMSGYAEEEIVHDEVFKVQNSCKEFIKKPFSIDAIGSLLRQQFDNGLNTFK